MSAAPDDFIAVSNLTKTFQPLRLQLSSVRPFRREAPVHALAGIDLGVRRGEILGLLGTNGAGKTTLLKILATLILPTSGQVTIDGGDIERDADRLKAMIGLSTCDERSFYWQLTGRQNLEFFAAFQGFDSAEARLRIEELRTQLGLEALDRRFGVYSTGMRHRLSIARALLHRPKILLLDEPTRSLDPSAAAMLRGLIRTTLAGEMKCTVVLATHNLEEASGMCDRIAFLSGGRLAGWGTIEELRLKAGRGAVSFQEVFMRLIAQNPIMGPV